MATPTKPMINMAQVEGSGTAAVMAATVPLVATAHPAKFPETVEPLIGAPIPVPPALAHLLTLPSHVTEIPATLGALAAVLA